MFHLNRFFLTAKATGVSVGSWEADWTANIRFWKRKHLEDPRNLGEDYIYDKIRR